MSLNMEERICKKVRFLESTNKSLLNVFNTKGAL